MTIKEMYENNEKINQLRELIENHNAIIASGRNVDEKFFEQLKDAKDELAGMTEIKEEEIDKKVSEYEEIVEKYEKNNSRMKELKELIENHNAIIASGRNVSEDFYKQLESFKEELANMTEVPKNQIMLYKRQLAIAYKDKIKKAPEQNKKYDELKELVDTHKSIISSGISVGTNYGDQYVEIERKLSQMRRVTDEDINKWNRVLEEVAQDDKEISELEELIETHESMLVSGQKVGPDFIRQLEELKKELAERKRDLEENREEESKEDSREEKSEGKDSKEENGKEEEKGLVVVEKPKMFQRVRNVLSSFGKKVMSFFKKGNDKEENSANASAAGDSAKKWRDGFKGETENQAETENQTAKGENFEIRLEEVTHDDHGDER